MRQSTRCFGQLSKKRGQLSEDDAREALADFLRRRHPLKTADSVVAETDGVISPAAARKMLDRLSGPSFPNFIALTRAYGAEFLVAVMGSDAPESLQLAALAERRRRYEQGVTALRAECGFVDEAGERG